jgi:hypothetical protein
MRIISSLALLFLIACNSADKTNKKEDIQVAGAWKMLSQNIKGDSTDTTTTSLHQLKIFTGDQMMYANINEPDSISSFGVGNYTISADTVTENVVYSSSDTSKDDSPHSYKLFIEKTDKGYKQTIPDIMNQGKHYKLTEEYDNAGTDAKTPLDGVWKLSKSLYIKEKDTAVQKTTQYKAYYGGHVIWGHTVTDSLNKIHTGLGFGKFEMSGNNKVKETMMASTYYQVRGKDFDLDITMNGTDEFTQTITEKDGSKGIETYQRLKK